MHPLHSFQSVYLDSLIKDQKPVTLYFKNGSRMIGILMGMTDKVIFFKHGITEYFYKHNINSIIPVM